MKRPIKLSERLMAIIDCIDKQAAVADIGADHGYLPVYLAQTGLACRIIASDISAGSLDTARRNAARFNVTDKIEFFHAAGLDCVTHNDVDTIVIAGVGGETILGILTDAPWTVEASAKGKLKLILQPQTKLDVLKSFLHDNDYTLTKQVTVRDRGREYTVLVVSG